MSKETTYAGMLGTGSAGSGRCRRTSPTSSTWWCSGRRLETLLAQGQGLVQSQSERTAAKQEASIQLREVMAEGQRLLTVLKLSVKQQYGIDSEKLAEFGLQPFRGRRRKVNEPPPVETPQAE